eukprot:g2620.t1
MSSLLSAIARRAPRAAGIVAGSGVGATRTRSVRMLSAGTVSGLSRPASGFQPLSALAPGTSAGSAQGITDLQHQQQQRRLLSIQSDDNQDPAEELGAADEGAAAAAAEEAVEEHAEEPEVGKSEPLYLLQVDGLPFTMAQEEIEQWFVDAGCAPTEVTVPLWPERSMRAGQNKGKAYMSFDSEEATQAGLALSGRSIGERWINISRLAHPLEEACRVTIKGLQMFSESDIATIFEDAMGARPEKVDVIDNPNRSRGLAFVTFETPELARAALALDGSNIHSHWVDVALHVTKQGSSEARVGLGNMRPFGPDVPSELMVVLKGLPFSLLEDDIKAFLVNHDIKEEDILGMEVPKYNETQFNTGMAMFHLRSEEAVAAAIQLKGTYIGDRWVDVDRWNERGGSTKDQKAKYKNTIQEARARVPAALRQKHPSLPVVAISGLPFHKTQDEVIEFLETNGVPRSAMAEIEMPLFLQTERNTGSCWVVMDDEQAYGSLMELNGAVMEERWLTINDA